MASAPRHKILQVGNLVQGIVRINHIVFRVWCACQYQGKLEGGRHFKMQAPIGLRNMCRPT